MRKSLASLGSSWQEPQVFGRFSLKTGESACFTGTISCVPWQVVHECRLGVAELLAPLPWMLEANWVAAFSWQEAHWAGGSLESCGASPSGYCGNRRN